MDEKIMLLEQIEELREEINDIISKSVDVFTFNHIISKSNDLNKLIADYQRMVATEKNNN